MSNGNGPEWGKRLFIAAIAAVVLLSIIAAAVLYTAFDNAATKAKLSQNSERLQRSAQESIERLKNTPAVIRLNGPERRAAQ